MKRNVRATGNRLVRHVRNDGGTVLVDRDELLHMADIEAIARPFRSLARRQEFVQNKRLAETGSLKYQEKE